MADFNQFIKGFETKPIKETDDDFIKSKRQMSDFINKAEYARAKMDKRTFKGTVGIPAGIKHSLMKDLKMSEEEADQVVDAYWSAPGWVKEAVNSDSYAQEELKDWLGKRAKKTSTPETKNAFDYQEINIPYHEGTKGRIVGKNKDVVTVEYTGKNGITRRDQYRQDEIDKVNEKQNIETATEYFDFLSKGK